MAGPVLGGFFCYCPPYDLRLHLLAQCVADPRDEAIPLTFLGGRVVNQYTVHDALSEIATVVPNLSLAEAGNDEEPRRHSLVNYVRGWVHFCKKRSW